MRAAILLCPLFVAACASSPKDLQSMPIAEVCYLGMVEPEKQQAVAEEVRRRNEDCNRHSAEIAKIRDIETRAGMSPGTAPTDAGTPRSGGGMGRGY
jgi:hypothetical protein